MLAPVRDRSNLVLQQFISARKAKQAQIAVLIDPDEYRPGYLAHIVEQAHIGKVDYFFVGGSLVMGNEIHDCIHELKGLTNIPVVVFPGSPNQINEEADALFFLSLISGRNADLLIGRHVESAPVLAGMDLEVLPTGYILVDGGRPTTVSYISNSSPIPNDKPRIAQATALAGQMLGLQLMYLDSGSGAQHHVSLEIIKSVSSTVKVPVIVGGGIRTVEQARAVCEAGANVIVVGNAFEKDPELIIDMAQAVHNVHGVHSNTVSNQ